MYKNTKIYRFYAHPKDMTSINTQKYAKIQRYTDSMHTQRVRLLYAHKDIQRYTKIYRFYAHPKDMPTIHTQKYAKIQRYTDSMHAQRV